MLARLDSIPAESEGIEPRLSVFQTDAIEPSLPKRLADEERFELSTRGLTSRRSAVELFIPCWPAGTRTRMTIVGAALPRSASVATFATLGCIKSAVHLPLSYEPIY
jgi:hypothetical protein